MGYSLGGWQRQHTTPIEVEAVSGLVIEVAGDVFVGAVVEAHGDRVVLEDRHGRRRGFAYHPGGFRLDGRAATLVPPRRPVTAPTVTRSGSVATARSRAQVAKASRLWVEGVHDAELVEHLWGDDLRWVGIVVEPMHGADDLAAAVADFAPSPTRRLGILLDHLVPGSKEHRLAGRIRDPDVLVLGHPFVDVWACIDPRRIGLEAWPEIPREVPWKEGICAALGVEEPALLWRQLVGKVETVGHVHRSLRHAVEALIDFVTTPDDADPAEPIV